MDAVTINKDGQAEMFSGQDLVPWHGLGTIVSGFATSEQAIKHAHLGWEVEKQDIFLRGGAQIEGYQSIVRKDNGYALGVAKSRYEIIQNAESFDFFDSVIGEGQAVYDTAGSLRNGRVIWIMCKLPGHLFIDTNPDDKIEKNVLLVTSHDSTFSLMMQIVGTRVVCWNTLSVAMREATNRIKIRHTKSFKKKIEEARKALNLTVAYFDNLQGVINILAKTPMNKDGMEEFTKRLFPVEDEADAPTKTINIRESVQNLFVNGKGNQGKSRWDALNAVTEFVDYHRATRNETSRFEAGLLGSGVLIKERAVKLLVD